MRTSELRFEEFTNRIVDSVRVYVFSWQGELSYIKSEQLLGECDLLITFNDGAELFFWASGDYALAAQSLPKHYHDEWSVQNADLYQEIGAAVHLDAIHYPDLTALRGQAVKQAAPVFWDTETGDQLSIGLGLVVGDLVICVLAYCDEGFVVWGNLQDQRDIFEYFNRDGRFGRIYLAFTDS